MVNMTQVKSNLLTIMTNLAAQSPIVMMEKRIVTTSIAFQASLKNSPKPIFWKNAKGQLINVKYFEGYLQNGQVVEKIIEGGDDKETLGSCSEDVFEVVQVPSQSDHVDYTIMMMMMKMMVMLLVKFGICRIKLILQRRGIFMTHTDGKKD